MISRVQRLDGRDVRVQKWRGSIHVESFRHINSGTIVYISTDRRDNSQSL